MKLLKEKLLLLSPVIALLVVLIFSLTMIPSLSPSPKNLPIAIVNEDQGVELPNKTKMNAGETIVQTIQQSAQTKSDEKPAVKWIEVQNEDAVKTGLNNQQYYAALVIPQNFSQKQATLQTPNPAAPEIQILVNQGMSTIGSNAASQILNQVVDNINNNVRQQLLDGFDKQGGTLTTAQANALAVPITKQVININETGTHSANGNAPVSLFLPLWIASLVGSILMFLAINKLDLSQRKDKLITRGVQVIAGAVTALIVGFGMTWICNAWLGLDIPQFTATALFLTLAYFCYFLMMSAVISWIGFGGTPIFALLLFFGTPLLSMPQELMSDFYRNWIYSWIPMRFSVEGLRELLFFGKGLHMNHALSALVWIGCLSLLVLFASVLKASPQNKRDENAQLSA